MKCPRRKCLKPKNAPNEEGISVAGGEFGVRLSAVGPGERFLRALRIYLGPATQGLLGPAGLGKPPGLVVVAGVFVPDG